MRSAALRSKGDALTNAPPHLSSASATVANTSGLGSLASRAVFIKAGMAADPGNDIGTPRIVERVPSDFADHLMAERVPGVGG
jgi:hypothetical protein